MLYSVKEQLSSTDAHKSCSEQTMHGPFLTNVYFKEQGEILPFSRSPALAGWLAWGNARAFLFSGQRWVSSTLAYLHGVANSWKAQ